MTPRAESHADRDRATTARRTRFVGAELPLVLRTELVERLTRVERTLNDARQQSLADVVTLARAALEPVAAPADTAAEYFAMYATYAKTLRTWLSAYGVAALAALLASVKALEVLQQRGDLGFVLTLILVGLSAQIALAIINKYVMWELYYGADEPTHQASWTYRSAARIVPKIWIDVSFDLVTVAAYLLSGAMVATALAGSGVTDLLGN